MLSKTTTSWTYNTGQREVTTTYPQGQQVTRYYNLLSGLQGAQLAVNTQITDLGTSFHDGLGRVVQYHDGHGDHAVLRPDDQRHRLRLRELNCDPTNTGNLSLVTALSYDQNLRPILKSVTRSDVAGTVPALPAGVADLALTVTTAAKGQTNKNLSYTITVKNKSPRFGGQPATGVTLSFVPAGTAAAGLAYTSIPAGCTAAGGVSVTLAPDADNPFQLASVVENWFDPVGAGGPAATPGFVNRSYTYDIAGNVTSDPYGRTYTYDAHGLLGSVTRADGGSQVLLRDGLGRIMQRQATWLADSVLDYGHARSSNHQWQVGLSAGTTYVPEGQFGANAQPNTLAMTDLLERPVNTLTYGTSTAGFGVLANTSYLPEGVATNLAAATAGFPAGIAATNQYPAGAMGTALGIDVGTGLEFKGGYRAYDPAVGRFLQWDSLSPLGRGGLNGYAYAGNDPVNFDDPTGHYREAKTHRYGPKPPHAHHEGFWQGLAAGLKAGAESIYLGSYHWGKTMEHDISQGNWAGLGKTQFGEDFNMAARLALAVCRTCSVRT
ncbi:RHS repeat-associated core domain-containing protein [uncultured Lamprocystis sp.]|uniref:RHS repeat-associated core domain-containing protein n=1 Tax=uncultured Lamprocystis sp. TaxID=543132 RepID=UPI0025D6CBB8|nr:RHS repeat-associated core domain-containing protein [uncultured Lamprocystis sp.]